MIKFSYSLFFQATLNDYFRTSPSFHHTATLLISDEPRGLLNGTLVHFYLWYISFYCPTLQWQGYTKSCQLKWLGEKANDLSVDLAVKHSGKIIKDYQF